MELDTIDCRSLLGPAREAPEEDLTPQPLLDYVLLEKEKDVASHGGLALPDSATRAFAKVIAVGPGAYKNGAFVKPDPRLVPGARVLFDAPSGGIGAFYWGGKSWVMTQACYLAAILPGEKPTPLPGRKLVKPATIAEMGLAT